MPRSSQAPTQRISARFGRSFIVTAKLTQNRAQVFWDSPRLGVADGEEDADARLFLEALRRLDESSQWSAFRHMEPGSLFGDLCRDWEPAHLFVAMNLERLKDYAAGKDVSFLPPDFALWDAYQGAASKHGCSADRKL